MSHSATSLPIHHNTKRGRDRGATSMELVLVRREGVHEHRPERIPLAPGATIVLGRQRDSTVVLESNPPPENGAGDYISRQHATLTVAVDGLSFTLRDTSSNGCVNDGTVEKRSERQNVRIGSRILFGKWDPHATSLLCPTRAEMQI